MRISLTTTLLEKLSNRGIVIGLQKHDIPVFFHRGDKLEPDECLLTRLASAYFGRKGIITLFDDNDVSMFIWKASSTDDIHKFRIMNCIGSPIIDFDLTDSEWKQFTKNWFNNCNVFMKFELIFKSKGRILFI